MSVWIYGRSVSYKKDGVAKHATPSLYIWDQFCLLSYLHVCLYLKGKYHLDSSARLIAGFLNASFFASQSPPKFELYVAAAFL